MHPTTIESRQSECLSDFEVFIEKKRLCYQTIESRQSECLSGFVLVVVLIEKTFLCLQRETRQWEARAFCSMFCWQATPSDLRRYPFHMDTLLVFLLLSAAS